MYPSPVDPAFGSFVAASVEALRRAQTTVAVSAVDARGRPWRYAAAALAWRGARGRRYHAHYGLAGLVAWLAGRRPLAVTFHGTDVRHPVVGRISRVVARLPGVTAVCVSAALAAELGVPGPVIAAPVDLDRFRPRDRRSARQALGLDRAGRVALFAADPARAGKRYDRARAVVDLLARRGIAVRLLSVPAGSPPDRLVTLHAAADLVLIPSDAEGFGLACCEALAGDVPVLATPVGIHPATAGRVAGCLVAEFDAARWADHAERVLADPDPRVAGRAAVARFSARRHAERTRALHGLD